MEDSEVTVASTGYANISIGPGGRIEDPLLLKQLGGVDPLPPRDLLKLAIFFQAYPSSTNAFLGERLLLTALITIVIDPRLQEGIEAITGLDNKKLRDTLEDARLEDTTPKDEKKEDLQDFIFYKHLSVFGIGLLIEGRVYEESGTLYFFVGVSPSPDDLPLDPDVAKK